MVKPRTTTAASSVPTIRNFTAERLAMLPFSPDPEEIWEVGVVTLPATVKEKSDLRPWHPVMCVCVSSLGGAMAGPLVRPEELAPSAPLDAIARFALDPHVAGAPPLRYVPRVVRVSAETDALGRGPLRDAMTRLGIRLQVREHLPILGGFVECMTERMLDDGDGWTRLSPILKSRGMCVERMRAFAEAADLFYTAAPWRYVDNETAWVIDPPPRTRALRSCAVLGAGGEEFGLGFFSSPNDLYRAAFHDPAEGRPPGTVWSMTYVDIEEAPLGDVEVWEDARFPLTDMLAFPLVMGVTPSNSVRRPNPEQLTLMEALLRGFAMVEGDTSEVERMEIKVETFDGPVRMELRVGARL